MRFKELLHGDFPEKYRKIYMGRAKNALANADDYVKVTVEKREYPWSSEGDYIVHFSWNLKNNFFTYYDLLSAEEQEQLRKLANKALKKIDDEFEGLKSQITPDKKFEVRVDYSLLFAVTHSQFNYRFEKWIREAVGERYHYLNSREYLKKINSLSGYEQQKAMRQHGDDVKQTLELLRHLKELEN
jgi:ElaB/YqjD/DUF883 family membrane-anchored ribosome-binding protein